MIEDEKRGPGRPAKKETVTMVVMRDYWTTGDGGPDDRVYAGTKVELSVEAALAGLETGAMRRVTEADK